SWKPEKPGAVNVVIQPQEASRPMRRSSLFSASRCGFRGMSPVGFEPAIHGPKALVQAVRRCLQTPETSQRFRVVVRAGMAGGPPVALAVEYRLRCADEENRRVISKGRLPVVLVAPSGGLACGRGGVPRP